MSKAKKLLKQERREVAETEIALIEDAGHIVERFTDYHWRIDERIDVWPTSKKFMRRDGNWIVCRYEKLSDVLK